jgi:hypothetical protein
MGRREEAIAAATREEARYAAIPLLRAFAAALRAGLEHRADDALDALRPFEGRPNSDGEMLFYVAEIHALAGDTEGAFARLNQAVDGGFLCSAAFDRDAYFEPLRARPAWAPLMARVTAAVQRIFDAHRGRALLGP